MLIKSLVPTPIDHPFVFSLHGENRRYSVDWMLGDQSPQDCSPPGECTQDICDKLVSTIEENTEDSSVLSLPNSTVISTMSNSSTLLRVYHRKKFQKKPPASCPVQMCNRAFADGFDSAVSSESLCGDRKENAVSVDVETDGFQSHPQLLTKFGKEVVLSKSGSCDECPDSLEPCSDEAFRSETGRGSDRCSVDDSCCSSKLNLDRMTASAKGEVDDTGECSSSGVLVPERLRDNMSEKDIFISIFRSMGLLENASCKQDFISADRNGMTTEARACRVCDRSESTLKMLICDQCEDAFHASCCNPRIRRIPTQEWFCYSCLKKRCKILVDKNPMSPSKTNNGSNRCRKVTSEAELGPIALMFNDTETYYSKVRVGSGFQAEVPSWSGPIIDEIDSLDEPKEMTESEYLHVCSQTSVSLPSPSSIGNWLQCQAVIHDVGDGTDGTICGKWRRAPLFEVQTDNWECFCAVLWDPLHADCAVPQELPTDEVLKQLKYIEMLRPRLTARKRKLNLVKTVGSRETKES